MDVSEPFKIAKKTFWQPYKRFLTITHQKCVPLTINFWNPAAGYHLQEDHYLPLDFSIERGLIAPKRPL